MAVELLNHAAKHCMGVDLSNLTAKQWVSIDQTRQQTLGDDWLNQIAKHLSVDWLHKIAKHLSVDWFDQIAKHLSADWLITAKYWALVHQQHSETLDMDSSSM